MKCSVLPALLLLAACGSGTPAVSNSPGGPPITYTKVMLPDYRVDLSAVLYKTDARGVITSDPSTSPGPVLIPGSVLGQSYAVLSGACPALTAEALMAAFKDPSTVSAPISNADLGLVRGAHLPHQGCILIANCYVGICSYQPILLTFTP
jgi:hypothetical protein